MRIFNMRIIRVLEGENHVRIKNIYMGYTYIFRHKKIGFITDM